MVSQARGGTFTYGMYRVLRDDGQNQLHVSQSQLEIPLRLPYPYHEPQAHGGNNKCVDPQSAEQFERPDP